jgi:hypothetical protein
VNVARVTSFFLRQLNLHEAESTPRFLLRRADTHQQLVALGETLTHGAQFAQQTSQPFAPHRIFFGLPSIALGQHIEFAFMLIQLHLH